MRSVGFPVSLRFAAAFVLCSMPVLTQGTATATIDATSTLSALVETVTPEPTQVLLPYESLQLTDDVLASLNDIELELFAFEDTTAAVNDSTVARLIRRDAACKVYPGDRAWPSPLVWALLDVVLGGFLVQAQPKARVCWGSTYDAAACAAISANWTNSYFLLDDPIEVFSPEFEGMTCQPPSFQYPYITTCTQGGYPVYTVKAQNVAQVQLAVNFARATGIRLVVKNTGHDFNGKSAGAGSLSIWTHNLKDTVYIKSYSDSYYQGAAVKAGAGIQAFEIYKFAAANGLLVVGGEGQTVGVMGGYIQGGGHSPLGSIYGMAADQVLAFEVVTPSGRFIRASSDENEDLFWALRGGGGGTFGIVTSVTVKAYPDITTTIASFTFAQGGNITADIFWAGVSTFVQRFPEFTAAGTYSYHYLHPNFITGIGHQFIMQPFFFPNMTTAQSQSLLAPWLADLATLGIPVSPTYQTFPSYYPAWQAGFPLETINNVKAITGSRLIPASNWASPSILNSTLSVLRAFCEAGHFMVGFHISPKLHPSNSDNAVNPAWRTAFAHWIFVNSWGNATTAEIQENWDSFSNVEMQKWRDVTPGSGAYLNECDRNEPNWQQALYGGSYERLVGVKRKWDPKEVFWVAQGVGSEGWRVRDERGLGGRNENGRLCRV